MERAGDAPHPLSVLLLDLDGFKRVNDTYFHAAGDRVLRVFADRVRSTVRREDMLVRRGGDEFVLVMPGACATVAAQTAERLREGLDEDPIAIDGERRVHQTISVGVATWDGNEGSASLEARADEAMYVAKNAGRNRVAVAA
jgi:diguanylate cyclase (GGDEF)-like protein